LNLLRKEPPAVYPTVCRSPSRGRVGFGRFAGHEGGSLRLKRSAGARLFESDLFPVGGGKGHEYTFVLVWIAVLEYGMTLGMAAQHEKQKERGMKMI